MDDITNRNKLLQKEVDKLANLLQLSERKRLNQKVLYDKNLENLYEKLADFENVILKEQKEIQLRLQKKDQKIKVREDLTRTLQNKLDNQFCKQCGYPTSKNKFDTDWELDIPDENKKEKYRKLPPLSLPLPEVLPSICFSNRLSHSNKSKLSPVAEECEVSSSSYLRNIHADQNQDRFHAVLTASLECLQVDTAKKNITPESERTEEVIITLSASDLDNANDFPHENKLNPRKLELVDPLENIQQYQYQTPRPSIIIESCPIADVETREPVIVDETVSEYANGAAISVLELVYNNLRRKKVELNEKNASINCIQSFSNSLAFGILCDMGSNISPCDKSTANQRTCAKSDVLRNPRHINDDSASANNETKIENNSKLISEQNISGDLDSPKLTNGNLCNARKFNFENHNIDEILSGRDTNSLCNLRTPCSSDGDMQITDTLAEKPRSYSRTASVGEVNKANYTRLSTMVVPLVDQAMTVAKTIVRRRSSTNLLLIDDGYTGCEDKGFTLEKDEDADDLSVENLSFSRRTLIELIDQAVEQVIPTVNCSKDNEVIPTMDRSKDDEVIPSMNCSNDDYVNPVLNGVAQQGCCNSENHSNINGTIFNEDEQNTLDSETSTSIIAENGTVENRENEVSKSKRKKSKKKKKKKKGVSDAGNRLPESVDQMGIVSVNTNKNGDILVNMNNNGNIPVSVNNNEDIPITVNDNYAIPLTVNDNGIIPLTMNANGDIPLTVNDKGDVPITVNDKGHIPMSNDSSLDFSFDASSFDIITSSPNNSVTEISPLEPVLTSEEDKFSLAVDQSFSEMEASRGSTPDTLDGFQ